MVVVVDDENNKCARRFGHQWKTMKEARRVAMNFFHREASTTMETKEEKTRQENRFNYTHTYTCVYIFKEKVLIYTTPQTSV